MSLSYPIARSLEEATLPGAKIARTQREAADLSSGFAVEGLETEGYSYLVGSGAITADFDEQLTGAAGGDTREFDADHPECFASEDRGATPPEILLAALASCLTAGVASVAQHREIQLRSVVATVEGKMNVLGILGADPDIGLLLPCNVVVREEDDGKIWVGFMDPDAVLKLVDHPDVHVLAKEVKASLERVRDSLKAAA